jgi:Cadherin-like domain/RTX calcium-binding nonapeptide repeat (4 copies)
MIKAKAPEQALQKSRLSRKDYVLAEKAKASILPHAFLIFLAGVAIYLRSFLPGRVEAAAEAREERSEQDGQATGQPNPENVVAEASPDESDFRDNPGSSNNVVPMRPRLTSPQEVVTSFLASDSPPIDFRKSALEPWDRPDQGHASNDNQAGRPPPPAAKDEEVPPERNGSGGRNDPWTPPPRSRPESEVGQDAPRNRAPTVAGPVRLQDLIGCSAYFIPVAALLAGASDADGDPLQPLHISASSGTITAAEGGGWMFTPDGKLGEIELTYFITDGVALVRQVAHFTVIEAPPIFGTAGDDNVLGTRCGDSIDGNDGDDIIDAGRGSDTVLGGSGDDHVIAAAGNDVVNAGTGNDIVFAGVGNDIVFGGRGNDRLFGEDGNDTINGDEGDDLVSGGSGDDILRGGEGNDALYGDDGNDWLDGGPGKDRLAGGQGDDVVSGDSGNDIVLGEDGGDVLSDGDGADSVQAGAGDDYVIAANDAMADSYAGNDGEDTLDYSPTTLGIVVDIGASTARGQEIGRDEIAGFEHIIGGRGNDHMIAGSSSVCLTGGDGDDIFEFQLADHHETELVRKITDFTVGDRIIASGYEIRYRESEDPNAEFADFFDEIYVAENADLRPIKFRFENAETGARTFVDVHDRTDPEDFYSIELAGLHQLEFTVVVPQQETPA